MNKVLVDLEGFFRAVDQAFVEVNNRFPEEVACKKGCDDCCQAVFDLSLAEAINLLHCLAALEPALRASLTKAARRAMVEFADLQNNDADLAYARIRCPILGADGACITYAARPINCRTYGIPTVINGTGHVCGLSKFVPGVSYPTVNLEQLQRVLSGFSLNLSDEKMANQRWPIAAVILQVPDLKKVYETLCN